MMDAHYIEAVRLLLEAIPTVFREPRFAMKGGTALNLFVQNLPRLSVDIDVVFTDHTASREAALRQIAGALEAARKELGRRGLQAESAARPVGDESKLFLRRGQHQVKVEVNHVFRGTLLPVQSLSLTEASRSSRPRSGSRCWPRQNCTAASSSPHCIGNTPETSSTSIACSSPVA